MSSVTGSGKRIQFLILAFLAPGVILLDQWTKHLILRSFSLNESISLIKNYFNITYVRNTGAAFGIMAQADPSFRVPFFLLVPVLALTAIGLIFKKLPAEDRKLAVALSLVVGGAIGNLIDRIQLGFVVDFLDFHWRYQAHYPTFNVADIAICIGVGLLLLDLFLQKKTENSSEEPKKEEGLNASHSI